jgi:uncharacterized protein YvpB
MPELQAGCEITAANIMLQYYGYKPSKTELLKYIPSSNDFYNVGGKRYGPNPWKTFVGDPSSNHYGCYAPVISNAMNAYLLEQGGTHDAVNLTGASTGSLYKYVDSGLPVIVWVTVGMQKPSSGDGWYLGDSDKYCKWIQGEHCMVLIGYDQKHAIFSDPLDQRGTVSYDRELFEQRFHDLSSQAVAVR